MIDSSLAPYIAYILGHRVTVC